MENQEEVNSVNASRNPSTEAAKNKIAIKMRAVYDAVKALKTMQKFVPSLGKGIDSRRVSLTDVDSRNQVSTVATLNYLDDPEEEPVDKKEFEEYANGFGKVTQYLGVGESFGENALKKDAPRSSGILCKTNCEFLTLEKQHFDEVFGQIQKEKEDFLVSVFPNLTPQMRNVSRLHTMSVNLFLGPSIVKNRTLKSLIKLFVLEICFQEEYAHFPKFHFQIFELPKNSFSVRISLLHLLTKIWIPVIEYSLKFQV